MKVNIITGSYPPDVCGVGDYTEKLEKHLKSKSVEVNIVYGYSWKIKNLLKIKSDIYSKPFNLIHIQYPTVGFGYSIVPQLLALICDNVVVTIHEVSQAHILRKLSLYPFFAFSKKIIFTSEYEKNAAVKLAPWIKKKSSIIHIGSNIASSQHAKLNSKDEIAYFGIIHPNKGIESVIELANVIDKKYKIHIIGKVEPRFKEYLSKLKSGSDTSKVIWSINKDEDEVSHLLTEIKYAYLPFPDGASERRGSLLAALINRMLIFSTKGSFTTNSLEKALTIINNPEDVKNKVDMYENDNNKFMCKLNEEEQYVKNFSWENIADKHVDLYQKISKYTYHQK